MHYSRIQLARLLIFSTLFFCSISHATLLVFQDDFVSGTGQPFAIVPNQLVERSAVANQKVYEELTVLGCGDFQIDPNIDCGGSTFAVWKNVRSLVHTANELVNPNEPIMFSLGVSLEELDSTLRWTAGEEFSGEGSMINSFANGQMSGLASRISALRGGARGFNLSGFSVDNTKGVLGVSPTTTMRGINAGDAIEADSWSKLGGFINGSYTTGDQGPTERENAFDFDGNEINGGLDYQLDDHWVLGFVFGYQQQEIDFDSSRSVVDGGVEMSALSIMPFFLYQSDSWFYSGSLGYQQAEFDTERGIRIPSTNPMTQSVDTVAKSTNDADIVTTNFAVGYSFELAPGLSLDTGLAVNYQDVMIDEYREDNINSTGYNLIVRQQKFESLETVTSLKLQYVISSRWGVFIPYTDVSFYAQHKAEERYIQTVYAGAQGSLSKASAFSLPTDGVDSDYKIYSVGVSSVIRGARQTNFGSAASGGIQLYFNYRQVQDIGNYNQKSVGFGLRYEF